MTNENEEACSVKLQTAIESLIYVLSSRDGLMRQSVRRSLVSIGEPAVPALRQAVGDRNTNVRWEAAKALGEIGSPAGAPGLVEALQDLAFGVRWLAADGLIRLGRPGLKPLLEAFVEDPDSAWLREGTHHVLRALADRDEEVRDLVWPVVLALESLLKADEIVPDARAVLTALEKEEQAREAAAQEQV